jgi:hypothetical protein
MRNEQMITGSKKAPVVEGLVKERRPNGRNIYDSAARRELVRLCAEPGVSISMTALANGMNTNVLRRWIDENKRDPVWFNRRKSNVRITKELPDKSKAAPINVFRPKTTPMSALMLPVEMAKVPLAVQTPLGGSPVIEVDLPHGRVRLHGADATMLATVFNLLSAA